ncbi:hypothetical protein ACTQ6A_12170 [Lachnospiraceae bacterium LCP25S3_G4]
MGEKNDWATENIKKAPYWRDGMTPKEYDFEREYYLKNFEKIRAGEIKYTKNKRATYCCSSSKQIILKNIGGSQ